jgi:hypothetical protein
MIIGGGCTLMDLGYTNLRFLLTNLAVCGFGGLFLFVFIGLRMLCCWVSSFWTDFIIIVFLKPADLL